MNMQGLSHQVREKEVQKRMKEMADLRYAEELKSKVLTEQQKETLAREAAKLK